MYGVYTYIYHKNQPNVGKYTIHGSYGKLLLIPLGFSSRCLCAGLDLNNDAASCNSSEEFVQRVGRDAWPCGDFLPCKGGATSPVTSGGTWGPYIYIYIYKWPEIHGFAWCEKKNLLIGVLTLFITGRGPTLWDLQNWRIP